MWIVAAYVSIAALLVVVFVMLRRSRAAFVVTGLVAAATVFFSIHLRTRHSEARRQDELIQRACSSLGSDLRRIVLEYRMFADSPDFASRQWDLRDEYMRLTRDTLTTLCTGSEPVQCLPHGLQEKTLLDIERGADLVANRQRCER
jgi:hypothetical protein